MSIYEALLPCLHSLKFAVEEFEMIPVAFVRSTNCKNRQYSAGSVYPLSLQKPVILFCSSSQEGWMNWHSIFHFCSKAFYWAQWDLLLDSYGEDCR